MSTVNDHGAIRSITAQALSRRRLLGTSAAATAALATRSVPRRTRAQAAELVFTYWGSPQEQEAVAQMTENFNAQTPNIVVRPQYIPNDGYDEKLTTMLAASTPPDIAYMDPGQAFDWAVNGRTLDLKPFVDADPESATLLPDTNYTFDDGKILSTSLAIGILLTFYNKTLFESAGVELPPTKTADAWTWDEFVDVAKRLTKDTSGRDAHDPAFDTENIDVYGVTFAKFWFGYLPFVWSNGGDFASEDGMQFTMNSPEAVDTFQKLQDLIHLHHVSPTAAQSESLPATDVLLRTGKVAMDINGFWKNLDYAQYTDLDWGVGILPVHQEPRTIRYGIPLIVSATTANPEAAYEFYRWRYSPERIDLYSRGLWMPIQGDYYTDPAKIDAWIDGIPGTFPEGARDVFITYALENAPIQPPIYWLKNLIQIENEAVNPALDLIWAGEATAQAALDEAAANAAPLMQGRY